MTKILKTRFIYISALEYSNVFITQVIDWLHSYQEKGVVFEIWRTSSIKKCFSLDERKETALIRNHFHGRVKKLYIAPIQIFFGVVFNTLLLLLLVLPQLITKKCILIQTRGVDLWRSLKYLNMLAPKRIKIIYDSRGAAGEEKIYSNLENSRHAKIKSDRISLAEEQMIQISDKIFCVSNVLIEYHLKNNPTIDISKFYLYPCCASSFDFYYSSDFRNQIRKQHQLEQKKVIIYSGGLKLAWHIPDRIFELFAGLNKLDKSYFLIVLSPDTELAKQFILKYSIPEESVLTISVNNSEVVKYLCASDIALLLRDDVPMNNVASPTKFAEYIMTGLPVIISKNVGDFSNFVSENDLGYVFNNDFSTVSYSELHSCLIKKFESYSSRRNDIAKLGLDKYSKVINTNAIIAQYHSLTP